RFNIAILKSLGAPGHFILQIYLAQVAGAAAIGVTIGLAAGMVCLPIIVSAIGDWTPISVSPDARALLIACGFSFLTTLLYTLLPLTRAEVMRPHILFRADVTWPAAPRLRRRIVALIAIAAALAGLFLWSTPLPFVASLFAVGAALVVVALFGFSRLIAILARITGRLSALERLPLLRLALANIHRTGAPTAPLLMAVGLCLILTTAAESLRQNVTHHLATTLPAAAPGLVVLNIDPAEGQRFDAVMAAAPQVDRWQRTPFLHARITRINGRAVTANSIPADIAYAVRGDRGISWWAHPHPTGSEIVDGSWWPDGYIGAPLASLDARVARRLGIGVGDTLTLDLPSKPLQTKIANLRYVDRTKLNLDFPVLLSPFADAPPHREIAAIWTKSAASHDTLRTLVSQEFPEVPTLLVSEVTAFLAKITARIGRAFQGLSAVTGLAAFLVLIGIVAANSRQRVNEAILLKVLGATRLQTLAVTVIEFAIIGTSPALAALLIGNLAAWGLIGGLIEFRPTVSSVLPWLITGALLPAVVSLVAIRCALTRRAAASLRRA
ncbi:MAG: hypothetical protein CMM16_04715, partial [Rhodospirillaceae bacterium]|nr:hypothetical protein [Rhodospirillaceae bacterium]